MKTYGKLTFQTNTKQGFWLIAADPHVMMRFKSLFQRANKFEFAHVRLENNCETCRDLEWFISRFPLFMEPADRARLSAGAEEHRQLQIDLKIIASGTRAHREYALAEPLRDYQARAVEILERVKGLLCADVLGLGKSVEAIGGLAMPNALPALIVVQAHLPFQWERFVRRFLPSATVHLIKSVKPYRIPKADVFITTYHRLAGWAEFFSDFFRYIIFDEVQELRHDGTGKWNAARRIRSGCTYALGLSATPIYNYGGEIYNVMEVLRPGQLGGREEFYREWCKGFTGKYLLKDPETFGSYMKDNFLMIRRTREEVGMELPPLERVVQTIPYTAESLEEIRDVATELAHLILKGSFTESGQAAREFDYRLRQATGIAKAPYVAEYVAMLVEEGLPVTLFGWHRAVYEVWLDRFTRAGLNPVMYTGTESPTRKQQSIETFTSGRSKVLIMSLRSGSGVDGIQEYCKTCVFGELDWSPGVHEQCIGRLNRDGSIGGVSAFFLVADGGSDPAVAEVLGLKSAQIKGMVDPKGLENVVAGVTDMARVKTMAAEYLKRHKGEKKYTAKGTQFEVIDGSGAGASRTGDHLPSTEQTGAFKLDPVSDLER